MHDQGRDNWVLRVGKVVVVNRDGTRRLTPESNAFWVTTKVGNIVADPFKSEALVKKTKILLVISQTGCIRLSENAQAVSKCALATGDCLWRLPLITTKKPTVIPKQL